MRVGLGDLICRAEMWMQQQMGPREVGLGFGLSGLRAQGACCSVCVFSSTSCLGAHCAGKLQEEKVSSKAVSPSKS